MKLDPERVMQKKKKKTIYLIKNFTGYYFCGSQHFLDNLCFHSEWYLLKRCFGAFQSCDQQFFLEVGPMLEAISQIM